MPAREPGGAWGTRPRPAIIHQPQKNVLKMEALVPTLDRALALTFGAEGGYVDNPHDRGGRTIYGISERYHPELWVNGPPTREAAGVFYLSLWRDCGAASLDAMGAPELACAHFDASVHHGIERAVILLQRAVGAGLAQDGSFGPHTKEAVAVQLTGRRRDDPLLSDLLFERLRFFSRIVQRDPTQLEFLRGWVNRVITLHDNL